MRHLEGDREDFCEHARNGRLEGDTDDTGREYRFYRFVTRRVKMFDEREFGGAVLVTATVRR